MSKQIIISKTYTAPGEIASTAVSSSETTVSSDDLQKVTNRGAVTTKSCRFGGIEAINELKVPVVEPGEEQLSDDSVAIYFGDILPADLVKPQKMDLSELFMMTLSDALVAINPTEGVLLVTDIVETSPANYINIEIKGYGKVEAGPCSWSGQVYLTSGVFADATIKSISYGELLDVRVFVQDGLVKLWLTGRSKPIGSYFKFAATVTFGLDTNNRVIDIQDVSEQTVGVTKEKLFKNFYEQYLRPLSEQEAGQVDRAVTSFSGMPLMQIWRGTEADYQSLLPQDDTLYFIIKEN